jgi:hypothetical protein
MTMVSIYTYSEAGFNQLVKDLYGKIFEEKYDSRRSLL